MQAHITRHYRQNCGDHAADVTAAHHYDPDERVEDMLCRVLGFPVSRWSEPDPSEVVTLQVVTGTEPCVGPATRPDPNPTLRDTR